MARPKMKEFTIRAGHGSMSLDGYVQFDENGYIIDTYQPFGCHEVAVDLLADGKSIEEAIKAIYKEFTGKDFSISITEREL